MTCTLPLRGEPDKLAVVSDQDPSLLVIHVEVDVTKVTDGSLLMFRSQAPILYFVSQLQLDQTTLSAFVTTVNETVKSVHAGHRPPDYTP